MRRIATLATFVAAADLLSCTSCATPSGDSWLQCHADSDAWAHAAFQQVTDPTRMVPQAALLFAAPILVGYDHALERRSVAHPQLTYGDTSRGNVVATLLGGAALGLSAGSWIAGDSGRSFEVLAESMAATMATTGVLKLAVPRSRPTHDSDSSFPSGHTAFSFCAATYLARTTWDATDEWWRGVGFLSYVPAAYVGISRIEGDQHFPSDVAVGAFLGALLTNWIYDAHVGDHATGRDGIFDHPRGPTSGFVPVVEEQGVGLAWYVRF
jgi:membrane-associated phospholipid phosphatase